eukprot:SAG31_NODE_156_length_22055_cov_105.227728_21_plen_126_part_00
MAERISEAPTPVIGRPPPTGDEWQQLSVQQPVIQQPAVPDVASQQIADITTVLQQLSATVAQLPLMMTAVAQNAVSAAMDQFQQPFATIRSDVLVEENVSECVLTWGGTLTIVYKTLGQGRLACL